MKFPIIVFPLLLTSCSVPLMPGSSISQDTQEDAQVKQEYPILQNYVLGATGCGASCGMVTEQLSHLEVIGNGWKRVKVKRTILINKCDYETRVCKTIPAPFLENQIIDDSYLPIVVTKDLQ